MVAAGGIRSPYGDDRISESRDTFVLHVAHEYSIGGAWSWIGEGPRTSRHEKSLRPFPYGLERLRQTIGLGISHSCPPGTERRGLPTSALAVSRPIILVASGGAERDVARMGFRHPTGRHRRDLEGVLGRDG